MPWSAEAEEAFKEPVHARASTKVRAIPITPPPGLWDDGIIDRGADARTSSAWPSAPR